MRIFSSLSRHQKEAAGLLQVGTFLEYFDLMLYVHMAVLLNELFFPKADPHTASLLTAFAFCSSYVLRPFGAFIFGFIGDRVGRKTTVIITTAMMSCSCLIMANLPTYAQIGIAASWAVTLCRVIQGLSSMGERIGAEIYLTELTNPPMRYPLVASISFSADIGVMLALLVASLVTMSGVNWRLAFWIGTIIALVGTLARTRLRETPDFVDMRKRVRKVIADAGEGDQLQTEELFNKSNPIWQGRVSPKIVMAYFFIQCLWPVGFYFAYMHCGNILKQTFGYTAEQVIHQNLIVSLVGVGVGLFLILLSSKIHPLKILKVELSLFWVFILSFPLLMGYASTPYVLLVIQCLAVALAPSGIPANAIFYSHFPIFRRFTYSSLIYATARAVMAVVTSFGLIYLTDRFGIWGLLIIAVPLAVGFTYGVLYFEELEKETESESLIMKQVCAV